jgi:hypothetical protein
MPNVTPSFWAIDNKQYGGMMLTIEDKVILNDDVVVTELEDEAVLLNMNTKMYYTLNRTGLYIWKQLSEERTLGEIGSSLQHEYGISAAKATRSVLDLVDHLHREQLAIVDHA